MRLTARPRSKSSTVTRSSRRYLLPAYFPKRDPGLAAALPAHDLLHEGSEKVLFTTPVEHLASRDVLVVRAGASVLEAARLMSAHRAGALVVVDGAGRPVGIVTTTDLRDRVLVAGRDPAAPVDEIMSAPLITVAARDFCFEALLKMMSRSVHHLVVLEDERMVGILSNHDFLLLQGTSPLIIDREIEGQTTVEGSRPPRGGSEASCPCSCARGPGPAASSVSSRR